MGKFPSILARGHLMMARVARLITAISFESGKFTKILGPDDSNWKDSGCTRFELICESLVRCGINHGDARRLSVAISGENTFGRPVIAQIIDVVMKVNGREQIKRGSIKDVEFSVTAAHKQCLEFRNVNDALRMRHSSDGMNSLFGESFEDFNRIVANHANKYPAARVERKMVDAAVHIWQGDCP